MWKTLRVNQAQQPSQSLIFLKDTLTDRICVQLILHIKLSVTIDTKLNFDGDFDGHGDGDTTCK